MIRLGKDGTNRMGNISVKGNHIKEEIILKRLYMNRATFTRKVKTIVTIYMDISLYAIFANFSKQNIGIFFSKI